MVFENIKRIWRPELFHGLKKGEFEGWYYKIVAAPANYVIAFVRGISMVSNEKHSPHAFIQVFDGVEQSYNYFKYELADFWYLKKDFLVRIDDNEFRYNGFVLQLN